jgi:hypothetical protein
MCVLRVDAFPRVRNGYNKTRQVCVLEGRGEWGLYGWPEAHVQQPVRLVTTRICVFFAHKRGDEGCVCE